MYYKEFKPYGKIKILEPGDYGPYGFLLKEQNGTIKKCECGNQLDLWFGDNDKTEYAYECSKCSWISDISRNYESDYAKKLGLYEKRINPL